MHPFTNINGTTEGVTMSENQNPDLPAEPGPAPAPAFPAPEAPAAYADAPPPPAYQGEPYQQPMEQAPPAYQGQPYQQQGYPQQPGYSQQPGYEQKSKIVAGILGILLGSLGIHRFYLGYTKIGIIQIVVTFVTIGFGGIWGFIEGIMILVGADPFKRDANGVPLKD
jgi:TM2 domain-containing membrane protein YozV